MTTEFGRKPEFDGSGRGHHPLSFSTVLAGGGVKRGYTHGASDASGYEPAEDAVTVGAFHSTIARAAGLPIEQEVMTPSGRPMTVGNKAKPVMEHVRLIRRTQTVSSPHKIGPRPTGRSPFLPIHRANERRPGGALSSVTIRHPPRDVCGLNATGPPRVRNYRGCSGCRLIPAWSKARRAGR